MEADGAYPNPEDERFYGCGRGTSPVKPYWDPRAGDSSGGVPSGAWVAPSGCPFNIFDGALGPLKYQGDIVCVGGYGNGFNYEKKSPADRLNYYRKLIAARAPGDPDVGGLPADQADGDRLAVHYFDCSDWDHPVRKTIIYAAKDNSHRIRSWNGSGWEDEGFDWDKNLPEMFKAVFDILNIGGSIVLAMTGVGVTAIAAWQGILQVMSKASLPGGHIDPGEALQAIFQPALQNKEFTKALADVALKNVFLGSLYAEAEKIKQRADELSHSLTSSFDAFMGAVKKWQDVLPVLSPSAAQTLLGGKIPSDFMQHLTRTVFVSGLDLNGQTFSGNVGQPAIVLDAVKKSVRAVQARASDDPERAFMAIRKLVDGNGGPAKVLAWRESFDAIYVSLAISAPAEQHEPYQISANYSERLKNAMIVANAFCAKGMPECEAKRSEVQRISRDDEQIAIAAEAAAFRAAAPQELREYVATLKKRYNMQ